MHSNSNQASAARCKGRLTLARYGIRWNCGPIFAAIVPNEKIFTIHRVGHRNAIFVIPAGDGIEERFFVGILELELPVLAAVGSFVDAGRLAVADAEDVGGVGVKGLDVAEVEFLGAGNGDDVPGLTAVDSADDGPAGSARPNDLFVNDRKSAKAGSGVDVLSDPLGMSRCGS